MIIKEPTNCGKALANKLKFDYEMVAENGASNERIVRRV